jgi:integrase
MEQSMKIGQKYINKYGRKMWGYDGRIGKKRYRDYRFHTKADAERAFSTLLTKQVESDYEWAPRRLKSTLGMAWASYKHKYDLKAEAKDYRYRLNMDFIINMLRRTFVDVLGEAFPVREITAAHLADWARAQSHDAATLNSYARRLSGMLRQAKDTFPDLVNWRVPAIRDYAPNPDNIRERTITAEEVELLINELLRPSPRNPRTSVLAYRQRTAMYRDAADVFRIALATGMRAKEIFRLSVSHLSRVMKRIEIDKTKTGYSRRIPLLAEIEQILDMRVRDGLTDGEHFFPEHYRTAFFDSRIRRAMKNACVAAAPTYRRDRQDEGLHSMTRGRLTSPAFCAVIWSTPSRPSASARQCGSPGTRACKASRSTYDYLRKNWTARPARRCPSYPTWAKSLCPHHRHS